MKSTSATTSIGGRGETRASKGITLRRVWTDTPIGRIHARIGGEALDGPPVVLVHGMVISSRYMVPTALELAPLCPVYAVDLPGYGDSVKPHAILGLAELADALAPGWTPCDSRLRISSRTHLAVRSWRSSPCDMAIAWTDWSFRDRRSTRPPGPCDNSSF